VQDIILTLDSSAISGSPQFVAALYHKKPGDRVRLGLLQGQRQFSVDVRVFEHEHASEKSSETANLDLRLVAKLGVLCAQVSGDNHLTRPTLRSDSGVMVVARFANSDTKNELASADV
jgi:hypothetical protein